MNTSLDLSYLFLAPCFPHNKRNNRNFENILAIVIQINKLLLTISRTAMYLVVFVYDTLLSVSIDYHLFYIIT